MKIAITIETEYPGEVARALQEQARRLRNDADMECPSFMRKHDIAYMATYAKATELEQVADQILETE